MSTSQPQVLKLRKGEHLPTDHVFLYPGATWTDDKGEHREVRSMPYKDAVLHGLVVIEWIDDPAPAKEPPQ